MSDLFTNAGNSPMLIVPSPDDRSLNGAVISPCGLYRYWLMRTVPGFYSVPNQTVMRTALFVMLNPSTADAMKNDASVRKLIGFCMRWRVHRFEVVNLYGFRATKPKDLWNAHDKIGIDNDVYIESSAKRASMTVVAWGNSKPGWMFERINHKERIGNVLKILRANGPAPYAIKVNGDYSPAHPLMLSYDLKPALYEDG